MLEWFGNLQTQTGTKPSPVTNTIYPYLFGRRSKDEQTKQNREEVEKNLKKL